MTLRPEETRLRDTLDAFLRAQHPHLDPVWIPGPDPPDLYLTLGAKRWAVEVSALAEQLQTESDTIPEATYDHTTDRLQKMIEEEARSRGILRGVYAMWFDGTPFSDRRSDSAAARDAALCYIEATHDAGSAPEAELFPSKPGQVTICKVGGSTDMVSGGMDGGAGWEGEIIALAEQALHDTLDKKRKKLREVPEPKILLLENRLGLAVDADTFDGFEPKEEDARFYEGVFVRFPMPDRIVSVYVVGALLRALGA